MGKAIESQRPDISGRYIDGDERDAYVDRPMKLTGVNFEPRGKFGPRWIVGAAMLDSGELVAISLADNPTRQTWFSAVREDLQNDGADAYDPIVLFRQAPAGGGNSFWTFRTATTEEVETAEASEVLGDDAGEGAPPAELPGETIAPKGKGKGR